MLSSFKDFEDNLLQITKSGTTREEAVKRLRKMKGDLV